MMEFVIRSYTASDKEQVKKLYKIASIHSEIGYRSGPWEKDFADIENHYLTNGEFLVGLRGNTIVAMGVYEKITNSLGHIRRMRVHPDQRRKGFAQQLLQKLESHARDHGLTELRLRTSTQQKMAQAFYEKNGFSKMNAEKSFYREGGGNTFEVIWYRKQIA